MRDYEAWHDVGVSGGGGAVFWHCGLECLYGWAAVCAWVCGCVGVCGFRHGEYGCAYAVDEVLKHEEGEAVRESLLRGGRCIRTWGGRWRKSMIIMFLLGISFEKRSLRPLAGVHDLLLFK